MTADATQFANEGKDDDSHEPGLPRVGDVVDGKYRIDRVLGSGGMGIVVAAQNLAIGVPVAMKFLRPSVAKDNEAIGRFKMEARASMRIRSEHVARVHDVATLAGVETPYMLMEYLEGEDLGQVTARRERLDITTAVGFLLEACEAIAEAHALGIVHRDLKPSNLFLARGRDGAVTLKVLDFGISKAMGEGEQNPNMTDTRATFGSPTYMSPEQIRSSKRVDFKTDIWALGVCLHEILTLHPPFEAENVSGLLASIIADAPSRLRERRPDAPQELEDVILRCLEKDLTRRYQSIAELATALEPFATARQSQTSLERVMRMSAPPSSSQKVEALRSSPSLVHARTEKSFGTSNNIAASPSEMRPNARKPKVVAALGIVALSLAGGLAMAVVRARQTRSEGTTPASSAALGASGEATPDRAKSADPVATANVNAANPPVDAGIASATSVPSVPSVPSDTATTAIAAIAATPGMSASPRHVGPPSAGSTGKGAPKPSTAAASVAAPAPPSPAVTAEVPLPKPKVDPLNSQY